MNITNYQEVIQAFHWPVLLIDQTGKVLSTNSAWNDIISSSDVAKHDNGLNLLEIIFPEEERNKIKTAIENGEPIKECEVLLHLGKSNKQHFALSISQLSKRKNQFCIAFVPSVKRNEDRLKNTLESADVGVWEWNIKTDGYYLSKELIEKFKLEGSEEKINEEWKKIIDSDNTYQAILSAIDKKQTVIHKKLKLIWKNGNKLYGTLKANVLYDAQNKAEALTSIISIIHFEDQLLHDQGFAQKDNIYKDIPDIYYSVDAKGKIKFMSESIERLLGYSTSELLGESPRKLYADPKQREYLALELQENGNVEDFRSEIIRKDGKKIWVSSNIKVKYDDNGYYDGYEGTVRDITEIVEREKQLRESEDRYKQLADITFEGIVIHKSGIVIDTNKAFCELVGYSRDELIGNNIIDLCVVPEWKDVVIDKIKQEYTRPYRVEGIKKDGKIFPVELESRATKYRGKRIRVTAVRDLTSSERFQEQIRKRERIIEALEHNVGHKTGKDYFEAAVLEIAKILDAKQVFIGHLFDNDSSVNTIAHAYKGKIENDFEYGLKNTPCENVMEGSWCCYPKDVKKLFDQDAMLQNEKYEGYVGVPLYNSKDEKIGILVGLFEDEIIETEFVVSVMQVFSIRSSVELERLTVEEKLKDSTKMLQTILDTIPVRVFWKDKNLRFLGANLKFAEDAGFKSAEQLIGKTDTELVWHNEAGLYNLDDRKVLKTGKAKMQYEEPQTNAEGKLSWLRTSKIPLKNKEGEIYGVLGVYEDITEKKISEKVIEESEKRFRTLAENVPGVIYLCKNEKGWPMIYLNDAVEDLTGYPKERFLDGSISFDQFIHPDNLEEIKKTIQESVSERKSFHLEYKLQHKDGSWKWVEEYGVGIYDNSEMNYLEGFIHDVTERKNAESARAESELRFRSLVENLNGVFWIRNISNNKLEYLSPQAEDLFGKIPDNVYEDPFAFIDNVHPDDRENLTQRWKSTEQNIPFDSEYRIVLNNGEIRTIWARANLIRDEEKGIFREFGYAEDITDKKIVQQEVEKLALVARQTDNAVIITDTNIDIEWVNEGFTRITGYTLDEVIGKNPGKILQGKATDFKTVGKIREAIRSHKPIKTELVNYKKTGEPFWVELNIQPIFDNNGRLEKFISIQSDVTDRKESEKFLAESEERHRIISEINFDYVYQVSLVGEQLKLDWVSGAFMEITGYSLQEVKSLPEEWISITLKEDMPNIKKMIRKYMLTGIPYTYEYRIRSKDGKIKWLRDRTKPILDENNDKLVKIIGAVQDITEGKKAEEENKKLALVAEKTDNAVIITDKNRRIEWVNEGFTRITGYTFEEAIGKKPSFLQGEDTDKNKVKEIGNKLNKKRQVYVELVNYRKNGEKFWVELNIQPIMDENDKVEKYISIQNDITERKNVEERTNRHNIELKKTNEELDNFVYRVSHDLKAPISSAKGLINIAKMEENPERISTCLDMIDKSMIRLDKFILDILDYSRNSRVPVEPVKISLEQTIDEILRNLTYLDDAKDIKKEITINDEAEFYSDRRRLDFVLNNILSNAIKFSDPEKDVNYINIHVDVDSKNAVIVCEDNGIGIEQEHINKIFNMFYRATERKTGSGLGLYIVKEAVEKLNGQISVKSTLGVGTKFTIVIPNMAN